ncbi:MAG: phosphohistidine phosphatase SixA [Candidatus Aminicenantes bacterium]|nr:phosphohistidine phosphatase SixA [Candidatus Aminicenantes bacterium]
MKLYLIQHGISLPEEKDPEKSLSLEGKEETQRTAEFLKAKNIEVDAVWHSPKQRAAQTAQIIVNSIFCSEIKERDDLNPLDPVANFPEEIKSSNKNLMIIGHLPFLQKLASLLLSGSETNQFISFKNSGVVCLEYTDTWKVAWMVTPALL